MIHIAKRYTGSAIVTVMLAQSCARSEDTDSPTTSSGKSVIEPGATNISKSEVITLPNGGQVTVTVGSTGVGIAGDTTINEPVAVNIGGQATIEPLRISACLKEMAVTLKGTTNGRIDINFDGTIPEQSVSIFKFYGNFDGNGGVDWTATATITGRASTQWEATLQIVANTNVSINGSVYRNRWIFRRLPVVNVLNLNTNLTFTSSDLARLRGDCTGVIDLTTGQKLMDTPAIGTSVQFNGLFPNLFPRLLSGLRDRIGARIRRIADTQLDATMGQSTVDINNRYNNIKSQLLGVLLEKLPKSSACTCPTSVPSTVSP